MFAMMIFMLFWSHGPAGGYCPLPDNGTDPDADTNTQPMVFPGLSWENLVLWLLATPVQVRNFTSLLFTLL